MPNAEWPGCLGLILRLVGVGPRRPVAGAPPYRLRDDFLSPAEQSFFRVLTAALAGEYLVCPKVNLGDLFFVIRGSDGRSDGTAHRNRIDRKHVDFLLCDPATLRPAVGIELDDASHARPDRRDRDKLVDAVFAAAGLPLLRVRAAPAYRPNDLLGLIRAAVADRPPPPNVTAPAVGPPACPKCGVPMLRRSAARGSRQDSEFWGCPSYPRCRETRPI